MHSIDETRFGSYKEPFTQTQYGAFVKRGKNWHFTAASFDEEDARRKARNYYEEMNKFSQNNMDMDALNDIQIRKRAVTYGLWSEPITTS